MSRQESRSDMMKEIWLYRKKSRSTIMKEIWQCRKGNHILEHEYADFGTYLGSHCIRPNCPTNKDM